MVQFEHETLHPAGHAGVDVRLSTVDSHTCGQQTRVVVDGAPALEGLTAREARDVLSTEHDWIRRLTVLEPRGNRSMFSAILLPRPDGESVQRVVFADAGGYPDMCGHATIGVATTLTELGLVEAPPHDGELEFALETPRGEITVRVRVEGGRAAAVTFRNQPSFFLETVSIPAPAGETTVDVAYGGQWYAFVEARAFGLVVQPEQIGDLVSRAETVRAAVAARVSHTDPLTGEPPDVGNIAWCDAPTGEAHGRNVPVSRFGAFDRSPCGTATCARLATDHAAGRLAPGEVFVNQGILDTVYEGRIVGTAEVGGILAVIPEITGSAWLTGSTSVWVDPTDPLRDGYLV
jgi:proline racemase